MAEQPREVASHTLAQMAGWIELFYDLVFVAAILVFSSAVSHLHNGARIGWVVVVFSAVWWVWLSTTLFVNRFHPGDVGHRLREATTTASTTCSFPRNGPSRSRSARGGREVSTPTPRRSR